jgi:hypothetical protein
MIPYTIDGDVLRLAVRLTPRARKDEVGGVIDAGDGRRALSIRLAAPPVDGAANQALIAFLARILGIPKSAVSIASGEKSRLKIVSLAGATPEALGRLIAS